MSTTQDQLDSFHRFASEKLNNGGSEMSLQELYRLWRIENPSTDERAAVADIISQGDADIESGNYRPLDEFMDEFRSKNDIPQDA